MASVDEILHSRPSINGQYRVLSRSGSSSSRSSTTFCLVAQFMALGSERPPPRSPVLIAFHVVASEAWVLIERTMRVKRLIISRTKANAMHMTCRPMK